MDEAKRHLSELLKAVQKEPVVIRKDDRDIAVVVSSEEYRRLRGANTVEIQRLCDRIGARAKRRGLTEEKLNKLLSEED
jgi:prevent-host-death family protein